MPPPSTGHRRSGPSWCGTRRPSTRARRCARTARCPAASATIVLQVKVKRSWQTFGTARVQRQGQVQDQRQARLVRLPPRPRVRTRPQRLQLGQADRRRHAVRSRRRPGVTTSSSTGPRSGRTTGSTRAGPIRYADQLRGRGAGRGRAGQAGDGPGRVGHRHAVQVRRQAHQVIPYNRRKRYRQRDQDLRDRLGRPTPRCPTSSGARPRVSEARAGSIAARDFRGRRANLTTEAGVTLSTDYWQRRLRPELHRQHACGGRSADPARARARRRPRARVRVRRDDERPDRLPRPRTATTAGLYDAGDLTGLAEGRAPGGLPAQARRPGRRGPGPPRSLLGLAQRPSSVAVRRGCGAAARRARAWRCRGSRRRRGRACRARPACCRNVSV